MATNEIGVLSRQELKGELQMEDEESGRLIEESKRERRTHVTTTYNDAARKILERDQPAIEDLSKETTLSAGTVMGVIKALQKKHHEGKLTTEEYREGVDVVLSSKHSDLEQRLRDLHPQLFGGMDLTAATSLKTSDEDLHEQLHTRHVLPVLTPTKDETQDNAADASKQTSIEGRPVKTWADLYVCLDACYRKAPLQFPLAMVCVMSLRYKEFCEDLGRVKKSAGLLECDADSPMRRMLKGFTKVLCSMLKDQSAPWLKDESPEFLTIVETLRKAMKAVFHRANETTCHFVAKGLSRVGRMLDYIETHDSQGTAILRAFFQRLFVKLAANESMQLCEAVRIIGSVWLSPKESNEGESTTIHMSATPKCERCNKDLAGLCIVNLAEFTCPACWIALDNSQLDQNQCIPLMLSSGTTKSDPLIPSSHLMAHQLNMWQSKPGTRHATLADQRRAILTTSQQEVRTVQGWVSRGSEEEAGRSVTQHMVWPGSQEAGKSTENLVDLDFEDPSPMKRIFQSRDDLISEEGLDRSPLESNLVDLDEDNETPTPGSGFDSRGELLTDENVLQTSPREAQSCGKTSGKTAKVDGSSRVDGSGIVDGSGRVDGSAKADGTAKAQECPKNNEFSKHTSCVFTPKPTSAEKRAGYSKTITAPIPRITQKKVLEINQRKAVVGGRVAKTSSSNQAGPVAEGSPPTSTESSAQNGELSGVRRTTLPAAARRAKTFGQKDSSSASLSPIKRVSGVGGESESTLTAGVDDPLILRLLNSTPKRGQGVVRR